MQRCTASVEDPDPVLQVGWRRRRRNFTNLTLITCIFSRHSPKEGSSSPPHPNPLRNLSYFTRFPLVPQSKPRGHRILNLLSAPSSPAGKVPNPNRAATLNSGRLRAAQRAGPRILGRSMGDG